MKQYFTVYGKGTRYDRDTCLVKSNITGERILIRFDQADYDKISIGDVVSLSTLIPIVFEPTNVEIFKCEK